MSTRNSAGLQKKPGQQCIGFTQSRLKLRCIFPGVTQKIPALSKRQIFQILSRLPNGFGCNGRHSGKEITKLRDQEAESQVAAVKRGRTAAPVNLSPSFFDIQVKRFLERDQTLVET